MEQFYKEWNKRSKYWFCKNDENDKYLSSNFGHLIDDYNYYKDNQPIIGILIYDQLSRHYYRNEYANHIITYFNHKALDIALLHKNKDFINNLTYNDWMFYMLVYRHTNKREYLLFAMEEGWKKMPQSKQFMKATYNRAIFDEVLDDNNEKENEDFDKSILDNNPEKTIINSLKNNKNIGDFSLLPLNQMIIVSLSGGVDSISCLFILSQLTTNLIAVHINYNNRQETNEEVKFLKSFCKKLNVTLYVRTIHEIKRQQCIDNDLRDVYESYTKRVRFNSYKAVNNENKEPIVILGHNKDDCFENILTNISYKNKFNNLKGIEFLVNIEGIQFYRPLINISKIDIYNYAKTHNLPYLKNSTPEWSQRGKIRTLVLPVLEKWDNRIIDGLFNISSILEDLHLNLNTTIQDFKQYDTKPLNQLNLSILYWKYAIFKIFNFYPSNKSLTSLIERLTIWKNKYDNTDLNKKQKIIIKKNLILLLWKSKNNTYTYILYLHT